MLRMPTIEQRLATFDSTDSTFKIDALAASTYLWEHNFLVGESRALTMATDE